MARTRVKRPTRDEADAARERALTKGPTDQDRKLARVWYEAIAAGRMTEEDLARTFTAVRFDAAYVRKLETDVAKLARDREALEASLRSIGGLRNVGAAVRRANGARG